MLPAAATALSAAAEAGGAPRFWQGSGLDGGLDSATEVVVYPRSRSAAGGYDVVVFAESGAPRSAPDVAARIVADLAAAGALAVPAAAIDAARVVARVTTVGGEGGEGVLPQEADLTGALSYRKGCYLGQEVMARIEARGSLKRGLATVELDGAGAPHGAAPSPDGRAIELDGRTVGVLGTSAVMPDGRVLALAVMRLDLEDGAALSVAGLDVRLDPAAPSILSS